MYRLLDFFNKRYNGPLSFRQSKVEMPFVITENGISDEDDIFRPCYLIEHLMAVSLAIKAGIPVKGYVFWTISDNFEWSDGYGPKFGLVAVDRANNLKRIPRPSYFLFSTIVKNRQITEGQRDINWQQLMAKVGKPRKLYRSEDGKTPLDTARTRPISATDWRMPKDPSDADWASITYLNDLVNMVTPKLTKILKKP